MNTKVKICGIQTLDAALAVIDAGADYIGFNFVPKSRRFINPKIAPEIVEQIRGHVKLVGVFQNADVEVVNSTARLLNLDFVQLHGQEDMMYIKKMNTRVIKVINSFEEVENYSASHFLLDRVKQGEGDMVGMDTARAVSSSYPVFLAGGLTPQNVAEMVRKIKPFAVDVAGGVETNGVKDVKKIKEFIMQVKGVYI